MKKIFIMLTVLASLFVMGCKHNTVNPVDNTVKGDVKITIGSDARTVAPANWKLTDIQQWTVTFDPEEAGLDNIVKVIETEAGQDYASTTATYTVPVGTYTVSVDAEGTDSQGTSYNLYGSSTVEVQSTEMAEPVIYVSLKKHNKTDDNASGSFSYTLKLTSSTFISALSGSNFSNSTGTIGDYTFSAYLTPISGGEEINLEITGSNSATGLELTVTNSEYIASGYYYLVISYVYDSKTFYIPLVDSLIEIADDLTTTGSFDDKEFAGVVTKTLYVENEITSTYNGLNPSYKKDFNLAIEWLRDNQKEWTIAKLYFAPNTEAAKIFNNAPVLTPCYKFAVNPTSSSASDDGYNKEVQVYVGEKLTYILKDGGIYVTDDCAEKSVIWLVGDDTHTSATINYSSFSGTHTLDLFQDEVNVTINNIGVRNPVIKSYFDGPAFTEYTADSTPYLTLIPVVPMEGNPVVIVNDNISVASDEYTTLTKSTNETRTIQIPKEGGTFEEKSVDISIMNCYTALAGSAGIIISQSMPEIEINGDAEIIIEDTESTYHVYLKGTEDSLDDGYSYEWFLNGNQVPEDTVDEDTGAFYLNPAINAYAKMGENYLMVVVSKDSEFVSASKKVTVQEPPVMQLYTINDSADGTTYYRSTSPSNSDSSLGLKIAVRKDNDTYFGVDRAGNILFYNGTEYDNTTYSYYKLPDLDSGDLNTIYSGYYDPDSGYVYLCLSTYVTSWNYYLVAFDTSAGNVPVEDTPVAFCTINSSKLYKSLFVKGDKIYGTTIKYDPSYNNNLSIRTISVDASSITLGEETSIDMKSTVYLDGESSLSSENYVAVTDFYFYDNYIYFLCKNSFSAYGDNELKALGYIGRMSVAGEIDSTYKVGWLSSPKTSSVEYEKYGSSYTAYNYTPNSTANDGYDGFWGPERIVAVKKADEIVIQDYGKCCTGTQEYSGAYMGVRGGFATVNLSAKTFSYTKSDIKFETLGSTSGWQME